LLERCPVKRYRATSNACQKSLRRKMPLQNMPIPSVGGNALKQFFVLRDCLWRFDRHTC
jgi:hypothetical protein